MSSEAPIPYEQYAHEFTHSEWTQLMIHFYRGEMNRATVWRQRLDVTTNWAVAATAAMLTFILGTPSIPHFAILLSVALVLIMLHIEARRYRYYDIWRARLRVIECGIIAPALWKDAVSHELEHEKEWRRLLAEDLHTPHFHMPYSEAFGRRLKRNYIWLLLLNYGAWGLKISISPQPVQSVQQLVAHAAIGDVPGSVIFVLATLLMLFFALLGPLLTRHRYARGEARPYEPGRPMERWGVV